MSTPFGPVFSFGNVEQWVLDLADKWSVTYLAEAERQQNEPPRTFADFKSFITANEWNRWPEEKLPCLLVIDTGLGEQPQRTGEGKWRARRLIGASVIVSARSRKEARWSAGLYSAAVRSMLLQHQDLDHPENIGGLDWIDERPAPLQQEDERSIAAQMMFFYVDVFDIADEGGVPRGPLLPNDPPPDPYVAPDPLPEVTDPVLSGTDLAPGGSRVTIRTRKVD